MSISDEMFFAVCKLGLLWKQNKGFFGKTTSISWGFYGNKLKVFWKNYY